MSVRFFPRTLLWFRRQLESLTTTKWHWKIVLQPRTVLMLQSGN
jgi:hypothetical protein